MDGTWGGVQLTRSDLIALAEAIEARGDDGRPQTEQEISEAENLRVMLSRPDDGWVLVPRSALR
jgi:hypothetical protein